MSGALAERDFVHMLERLGFEAVKVVNRRPWGIADCERYPLFSADLIDLMRRVVPVENHDRIAESIVIKARLAPGIRPNNS